MRFLQTFCRSVLLGGAASIGADIPDTDIPSPDHLGTGLVAANIYVCTDARGMRTYTDRGCPGNTLYTPPAIAPLQFEPLAAAEAEQLRALDKRVSRVRQDRQQARQRVRKKLARQKLERQRNCERTNVALAALAANRRKGYKLSAQAELDATEAALKKDKRHNCT